MSTKIQIPLVGGSYKHDVLAFDAQETINMFPERGGKQSKSQSLLRRFPGFKDWITLSAGIGKVRGMYVTSNDRAFIARDNQLIEVATDGTETVRGSINAGVQEVHMQDNGVQLGIADGTNIWEYVLATNVLTAVTSVSAPDTTPSLEFADGRFIGFDPSAANGTWRISDLNDVTAWTPANVYTAEGSPDKLVAIKVHNREVWLFGSKSFEVYQAIGGGAGSEYARIDGTFKNIGLKSRKSVSIIRDNIIWLGSSKDGANIIWRAQGGYQPHQISTKAMETEIASYASTDDAWSFTFEYLGHHFYVISFQSGNKTWVYSLTDNEWVNWAYREPTSGDQGRIRCETHMHFNGKNYVGDYVNGNIYELDKDTYTDNGNYILAERKFPYVHEKNREITIYELFIDFMVGYGLLTGQGSDPKVQIRWSHDGGHTWDNWQWMGLGVRGDYGFQSTMQLMGAARSWVIHIRCMEPMPFAIQDNAIADVDVSED